MKLALRIPVRVTWSHSVELCGKLNYGFVLHQHGEKAWESRACQSTCEFIAEERVRASFQQILGSIDPTSFSA